MTTSYYQLMPHILLGRSCLQQLDFETHLIPIDIEVGQQQWQLALSSLSLPGFDNDEQRSVISQSRQILTPARVRAYDIDNMLFNIKTNKHPLLLSQTRESLNPTMHQWQEGKGRGLWSCLGQWQNRNVSEGISSFQASQMGNRIPLVKHEL